LSVGAVRIAVDIGGTFTDVAVLDEETGEMKVTKVPTTPKDFVEGFLNGIKRAEVIPRETTRLIHGTTVATNAVIQRTLPLTAIVTTRGFEDILEIMRGNRPMSGLYDIRWKKPAPIIPRWLRFGVSERIDCNGRVVEKLDEEQAKDVVSRMKKLGVKSVAICLLFSNVNPSHEQRVAELISESLPNVTISLSSYVNPQIREYERTSTTAIDASVKPVVAEYLQRLETSLSKLGFSCPLMIMKSSGGIMSSNTAKQIPIETIESGPAGGVIGAANLAFSVGEDLLAIDMGGTTFKVSVIEGGTPRLKNEGEVEWGIPYRTPMIDLSEIGAGGGSIAWIDSGGILRVGPQSAGADPGPVCYGIGGDKPTFTDASLVLGRIDPDNFLGGEMRLRREASEEAITEQIAKPLGMEPLEAAAGIVKIAEANMLGSMRVSSVERGYDPRDFVTVAYGGAGPMVASTLARELGSPTVVIPPHPGIFSSIGMLYSDLRLDVSRTHMGRIESMKMDEVASVYADLESKLESAMREEDFAGKVVFLRFADIRYVGQNYEVTTRVPPNELTEEKRQDIIESFNEEHKRIFGHSKPDEPIEMLTLRVAAIGGMRKPARKRQTKASERNAKPRHGHHEVYFEESESYQPTPSYERGDLGAGYEVTGPAIIHEMDSTIVVRPRQLAAVDDFGNVVINLR
jgi:N-methylhydantoinase A